MVKKQRLVAVRVTTSWTGQDEPTITPVSGESLAELLEGWRIVQMEGLGPQEGGDGYAALLLLEERPQEGRGGPLGFGAIE
ncbi:MAG TPA: hypothetical protein VF756_14075 [Thermoanaerobaculia bacterium]